MRVDHDIRAGLKRASIEKYVAFDVQLRSPTDCRNAVHAWAQPLVDLLAFATNGYVELQPLRMRRRAGDRNEDAVFHHRLVVRDQPSDASPAPEMLLPFASLDRPVGRLIEDWFAVHQRYGTAITMLLLPDRSPGQYGEMLLLTGFNALEAYQRVRFGRHIPKQSHDDRVARAVAAAPADLRTWVADRLRSGSEKSQSVRFDEVFNESGATGIAIADAVPSFRRRVLRARQQAAHGNELDPAMANEYFVLNRGLRWLVRHCLLLQLGLSSDVATAHVAQSRRFRSDLELLRRYGA